MRNDGLGIAAILAIYESIVRTDMRFYSDRDAGRKRGIRLGRVPMPSSVTAAWVLTALQTLAPGSPYAETFERTADAIATEATLSPLYEGEHGAEKTAALLASVAWFESSLRPDAAGDKRAGRPTSFCLLQINETNHRGLGVTRDDLMSDVHACVHAGLAMMATSFRLCRRLPHEQRLLWYAAGSDGCDPKNEDARRKSEHRVRKAMWLYDKVQATLAEVR